MKKIFLKENLNYSSLTRSEQKNILGGSGSGVSGAGGPTLAIYKCECLNWTPPHPHVKAFNAEGAKRTAQQTICSGYDLNDISCDYYCSISGI